MDGYMVESRYLGIDKKYESSVYNTLFQLFESKFACDKIVISFLLTGVPIKLPITVNGSLLFEEILWNQITVHMACK